MKLSFQENLVLPQQALSNNNQFVVKSCSEQKSFAKPAGFANSADFSDCGDFADLQVLQIPNCCSVYFFLKD